MVRPATTSSRRLSSRSDVRAVFVAGAGTEIGKTYVTASLTRALRAQDCAVSTLKPLASGVPPFGDPAFRESDTAILLDAQGMPLTAETVEACSPWRFAAPLSPDLAAAREGRSLSLSELVSWCEARLQGAATETIIVIEGVGGLMSPVDVGGDWPRLARSPGPADDPRLRQLSRRDQPCADGGGDPALSRPAAARLRRLRKASALLRRRRRSPTPSPAMCRFRSSASPATASARRLWRGWYRPAR